MSLRKDSDLPELPRGVFFCVSGDGFKHYAMLANAISDLYSRPSFSMS